MADPLVIKGVDVRMNMYGEIARVHKQIVEAKWRAKTAGAPLQLKPAVLLHLEASIAFLAEELLKLGKLVESGPEIET